MGNGGTGDRTLGRVAVIVRALLPLVLSGSVLSGCKAVPQIAGVLTGGAIGVATASPALGFATGIATDAAAHAGVQWYGRSRANAEQDVIAQVAGGLGVGERGPWHINHFIPIGDEHGELYVVRVIETPLAVCKRIVFSVDSGSGAKLQRAWYSATACRQGEGWKWADAEPAVARWGYLQ